ncbi:histidine phosphatase family protein [Halodesulfovibrio spirochaetisodalis]|uniref:histidine phosphatase family protein n=1 Tax=Halodesulfovibrio spirochaetisodalis TaxID=1560234 RepID=UPI00082CBCC9|nr:histidine phosphatase family protein [Halodesulfovibrio spirochaetisodalis]
MLYLVRHGETILRKGICIGQTDIPLAKKGFNQIAEQTIPQLLTLNPLKPVLLSSPLIRTMQTGKILSNALNIPIIPEDALKEINMGKWDGLAFSYIQDHWPDEYQQRGNSFAHFRTPQGESFFDVQQRVLELILPLCHTPEPIICVTHAGVIRTLLCAANQRPLQDLFTFKPATGSITILSKKTFTNKGLYLV